jgi:hypothetical protein
MLEDADHEREELRPYLDRFHEADKTASVLRGQISTNTTIEVFFGVGVGLGGTIIGLAPFFWDIKLAYGATTGIVGLCLIIGSTAGRLVKR